MSKKDFLCKDPFIRKRIRFVSFCGLQAVALLWNKTALYQWAQRLLPIWESVASLSTEPLQPCIMFIRL